MSNAAIAVTEQQTLLDQLPAEGQQELIAQQVHNNFYLFCIAFFSQAFPGIKFVPNWHVEAMCILVERAISGECPRLLINLPPRYLKSFIVSVALPAYLLGKNPQTRLLVATYSRDLGVEHAKRTRRIMNSALYKRWFPNTQISTENNEEVQTTLGGNRRIVTPRSSTQGFGADYIVIDDIINGVDARSPQARKEVVDFYQISLRSRLNNAATGPIISVQQRLHEDDFPAFLIDQGGFTTLTLKAIADTDQSFELYCGESHKQSARDVLFEEFQSRDTLENIRLEIGNTAFEAQYQQNPIPPGGTILDMSKLQYYAEPAERAEMIDCYQVWDTAFSPEPTADFSVCITFGFNGTSWLVLDVYRQRLSYPDLLKAFWRQKRTWDATRVHIENHGSGQSLIQDIRSEDRGARSWLHGTRHHQDKETRLAAASAKLESGLVKFPAFDAPWKEALLNELRAFPNGKFDDQVDVISLFVGWVSGPRRPLPGRKLGARRNIVRAPGTPRPWRR